MSGTRRTPPSSLWKFGVGYPCNEFIRPVYCRVHVWENVDSPALRGIDVLPCITLDHFRWPFVYFPVLEELAAESVYERKVHITVGQDEL